MATLKDIAYTYDDLDELWPLILDQAHADITCAYYNSDENRLRNQTVFQRKDADDNLHGSAGRVRDVLGEFAPAADVIRMDVRFSHMRDLHIVLFRDLQVGVDVALWVDNNGHSGFLASDEIARLRKTLIIDVLEIH